LFWSWFKTNASRFAGLGGEDEDDLLDEFERALHLFHPELYFEIGGRPEGPRELVITADGDRSLFPLVEELVAAAPAVPGWEVIAFKQAGGFECTVNYQGLTLDPAACWFRPLVATTDRSIFGLQVASPAYSSESEKTLLSAVYVLLDSALGELACAEQIQHVEVAPLPAQPETEGFMALRELPEYLAWLRNCGSQRS